MSLVIEIVVDAGGWRGLGDVEAATRAAVDAGLGVAHADVADDAEVSVLLCDDARIQVLNRDFRGLDKPTNVLSFPAADMPGQTALGDIAVAYETVAREAEEAGRSLSAHYSHMIVHGLLHLLGHDHENDDEAEEMEALERLALARIGVGDPYADERGDARAS